jgi:hypothetical protein
LRVAYKTFIVAHWKLDGSDDGVIADAIIPKLEGSGP